MPRKRDTRGTQLDLYVVNGTTFSLSITVLDENGDPADLSGATVDAAIIDPTGTLQQFDDSIAANVITIGLDNTTTTSLEPDAYRWRLIVSDGSKETYLAGRCYVTPDTDPTASPYDAITLQHETVTLVVERGAQGEKGDKGDTGDTGPVGPEGPQGVPGEVTDAELQAGLDLKVDRAGDTMTGPLTITGSAAQGLNLQSDDMRVYKRAADGTIQFMESGGATYRRFYSGNFGKILMQMNASNIAISDLVTEQSLLVPAPPEGATTSAGQVVAADSTTGRLAMGGPGGMVVEIGDTGWRDVSGELLNGFTVGSGTDAVIIRRVGDRCYLKGKVQDPGPYVAGTTFLGLASGFRNVAFNGLNVTNFYASTAYGSSVINNFWINGSVVMAYTDLTPGRHFELEWFTQNSWPAALPGTAYAS